MPRKIGFILVLMVFVSTQSLPQDIFCPQVANYFMDVTLDPDTKLIRGKEWLTWTNTTESSASELWFHLYWNAFQNNRSTFLTELSKGGRNGWADFDSQDWGYCRVTSLQVIENADFEACDVTSRIRFRQPDDGNAFDQTVFSVRLPQPIAPGQTFDLVIAFESKVPKPISRTGVYKDYYFIAQWFPKLGVFENGIWNCHQYHSHSEYYADYGTYDVKITLPSSFVVGATGEHRESVDNGEGSITHRFYQHSVHDFAWVASPDLLHFSEDFEFAPGKKTELTLLLQPYHAHLKPRYMLAIQNAVHYSSLWYKEYPYSTVTCVDPAYNSGSGGMEYPTFFTAGAYFLSPKHVPSPEGVTIHEFGHGYFYGLLGTNEFEYAWMDEGMTSYLDTKIYYQAYGEPVFSKDFFGVPVTFPEVRIPIESGGISSHRSTWDQDDMQRLSWQYMDGGSYGANAYAKGQLLLLTLSRYLGDEVFSRMMQTYVERWSWKHPRPQDFAAIVSEFAGKDMSWFMDQFLYGSKKLDYSLGRITNRVFAPQQGLFDLSYLDGKPSRSTIPEYRSEVLVRRLGDVKVPVDIRIELSDGTTLSERWDGQYRWKIFSYRGPMRIIQATVDPEFIYALDINRTNNSRTVRPNRLTAWKWTAQWLHWLQHALEFFTVFGG